MKKQFNRLLVLAFLSLGGVLAAARPSRAGTDPETTRFLEKLNLSYCCLIREGLKNFTADFSVVPAPEYQKALLATGVKAQDMAAVDKIKYKVTCFYDRAPSVTMTLPSSTGVPSRDAYVAKMAEINRQGAQGAVVTWLAMMFRPLHSPQVIEEGCQVQKGPQGFTVTEKSDRGVVTETFDQDSKLLGCLGNFNQKPVTFKTEFTKTPQGFLLTGAEQDQSGTRSEEKYECARVGDFWLLKKMRVSVQVPQLPGKDLSYIYTFSNYQLNQ